MRFLLLAIVLLIFTSSCVAVREYDMIYLNDSDMILGARASERFEANFQIYREASSGANGGKTGGGCGCN